MNGYAEMDVQDDIIMALSNEMVERGPRMVAEYDASKPTVTFPEWVASYQVEHHLPYDLSTWASCIMPLNDPRRKQHDGKLDEDYQVFMANGAWSIEGVILEHKGVCKAIIRPQQALSLLDWLLQEKPALEKLVKEQAS